MPGLFGGIDPGKDGYLALYDGRDLAEINWMPVLDGSKRPYDLQGLDAIFKRWRASDVRFVLVEGQGPMPREGAVGAFSIGEGFGILRMGLYANGIPFSVEKPGSWKRALGIPIPAFKGPPRSASKEAKAKTRRDHKALVKAETIKAAQALFPGIDFRRTSRCKKISDDKAEASLLAVLSYRRHGFLGE